MKILVMTPEAADELKAKHEYYNSMSDTAQGRLKGYGILEGLRFSRSAMTAIDIPDGCKLAVVELETIMVNMPSVGPVNWRRVRRVVQEVM